LNPPPAVVTPIPSSILAAGVARSQSRMNRREDI
jgi:hypothetical protein